MNEAQEDIADRREQEQQGDDDSKGRETQGNGSRFTGGQDRPPPRYRV
jgi:hypothetical protein